MSILDRLFRRGERPAAPAATAGKKLTDEEARLKRLALWEEVRKNPTQERAAEIVEEASALLEYFGRDHPMHDNITELIRTASEIAGKERLFVAG